MEADVEVAFTRAVSAVNADSDLLREVELVANPKQVPTYDSFHTATTGG